VEHLDRLQQKLGRPSGRLHQSRQQMTGLQHRLSNELRLTVQRHRNQLQTLHAELPRAVRRSLEQHGQKLERHAASLGLLDPHLVLERGYALLSDSAGVTITRTDQTRPGQAVRATLAHGSLGLTVDP
jgi:exodeoxyribonuclease VII large subunit